MNIESDAFGDFEASPHKWITIFDSEFYPDTLSAARAYFEPIVARFGVLLATADGADALLRTIQQEPKERRVQLLRVFRRYISPDTSVEMLKRIRKTDEVITEFGDRFRDVETTRQEFAARPAPDETLMALLYEHLDRGQKGYDLTEAFFLWFEANFAADGWTIEGPRGAGRDIELQSVWPGYSKPTPVDFILRDPSNELRVVGFARYDSDRGGAQEDDRIGGNERRLREILGHAKLESRTMRVLFVNDGPGLVLGSMWRDYASVESGGTGDALVTTLKMAYAGRLSANWMAGADGS